MSLTIDCHGTSLNISSLLSRSLDSSGLELDILRSLAVNLAEHTDRYAANGASANDLEVITNGLKVPEDVEEEEEGFWHESTLNHSISYTHYVRSLPIESISGKAQDCLDHISRLIPTILAPCGPAELGETSQGLRTVDIGKASDLLTSTLYALRHLYPVSDDRVLELLTTFVSGLGTALQSSRPSEIALSVTLVQTLHSFFMEAQMPWINGQHINRVIDLVSSLSSPSILDSLDRSISPTSTPASTSDNDGNIRVTSQRSRSRSRRQDAHAIAMHFSSLKHLLLITDIQGAVLSLALTPNLALESHSACNASWRALTSAPVPADATHLDVESVRTWALGIWSDVMNGEGIAVGMGVLARASSSHFGGHDEGEDALLISLLKLFTLASLHSRSIDEAHYARLKLLLSEKAPTQQAAVMEFALSCIDALVLNNPSLATSTAIHVRRYATTPLPIFEAEMAGTGLEVPELMIATARCLALCLRLAADDDLTNSTVYSLMNATTGETSGGHSIRSSMLGVPSHSSSSRSSEQRRMMGISTVGMVARLGCDLDTPEAVHSTVSMLLQRLRGADSIMEATIVSNLIPLAIKSNDNIFGEVVKAFSQICRSANPEDPRHSANAVLSALTSLARGLEGRYNACELFLLEVLSLIVDKGAQIQLAQSSDAARISDMTQQLAALLLPLDAVLQHGSCQPSLEATPALVALFRNAWFTLTMHGVTNQSRETTQQALSRIALKTPALVLEVEKDFASGLEYSSVFRRDFASHHLSRLRQTLSDRLPKQSAAVKSLSLSQVTFLLATHDLELRRSNRPSVMLAYFCNNSLNESEMSKCLDAIADDLLKRFLDRQKLAVLTHAMPGIVSEQVRMLLVGTTHRFERVRSMAIRYLDKIFETFSALMCDRKIVFALLEILTLLQRSCEDAFTDEYSPSYHYKSAKLDIAIEVSDDYAARNLTVDTLYRHARKWLDSALSRAPIEMQSILQRYLRESGNVLLLDSVELGAGLAMQYAKAISRMDRQETLMPNIAGWPTDSANLLASQFSAKSFFAGELSGARLMLAEGLAELHRPAPEQTSPGELKAFRQQMGQALRDIRSKNIVMAVPALRRLLLRAVSVLIASPVIDREILHYLVALPMRSFTALGVAAGVDAWSWLISERPDIEVSLISEISDGWIWTIKARKGLFSEAVHADAPLDHAIEYAPTDKAIIDHNLAVAQRALQPHTLLVAVISSRFQAVKYREAGMILAILKLLMRSFKNYDLMSTHPLAREVRFSLVLFGLQVLRGCRLETLLECRLRDRIYGAALSWFATKPVWSFGSSRIQAGAEMALLEEVLDAITSDRIRIDHHSTSLTDRQPAFPLPQFRSARDYIVYHKERVRLLQILVENEIQRLQVWSDTTEDGTKGRYALRRSSTVSASENWVGLVRRAWSIMPATAVHMVERFKQAQIEAEVIRLIRSDPKAVLDVPEAAALLLGGQLGENASGSSLQYLPLWRAVPAVTAVTYFQPRFKNHPLLLQYAMRVLEQHPVELTFFFVPQVVQALRSDSLGYVSRFIFETSKISQLFCHQIIWNMKANCYKDDLAEVEDPMKPVLDRTVALIVSALSGKARAFYNTEFGFFNEVTSISGKLKDYIKRPKPEKKAKIDEEMAKIEVKVGVYLPSNPDGVVVDLDRKSGRPLQSHAKAPFMATFKVRKERTEYMQEESETTGASGGAAASAELELSSTSRKVTYDVWQAAIFKVGDDCRQDVLALQMIAMFKNIFQAAGLVLYLFPYRVTATAPGCGVIDVVPNATSRDEMGRAKINDLYSYFVDKYGSVETIAFQRARMNFVQSMAAYSVACYILQIKDRHNGNIMIDGDGHIVHIDFGFLFDIGPGGVKFEPNSFKLNHEMVVLMGGRESQGYRMFCELTVKAFLAIRPFADQLVDTVHLMLGTGLPSFKGEPTIHRLKERFQLQLTEREAARYMMGVIKNAHENFRSVFYDGFQKAQNGIPY